MEHLRRAAAEQRSLNAQAVHWLEQAARQWMSAEERSRLLQMIRSSRQAVDRRHGPGSDSAKAIRQMRDERAKAGQ